MVRPSAALGPRASGRRADTCSALRIADTKRLQGAVNESRRRHGAAPENDDLMRSDAGAGSCLRWTHKMVEKEGSGGAAWTASSHSSEREMHDGTSGDTGRR